MPKPDNDPSVLQYQYPVYDDPTGVPSLRDLENRERASSFPTATKDEFLTRND